MAALSGVSFSAEGCQSADEQYVSSAAISEHFREMKEPQSGAGDATLERWTAPITSSVQARFRQVKERRAQQVLDRIMAAPPLPRPNAGGCRVQCDERTPDRAALPRSVNDAMTHAR